MASIRTRLCCDSDDFERRWTRIHYRLHYQCKHFPVIKRGHTSALRRYVQKVLELMRYRSSVYPICTSGSRRPWTYWDE